MTHNNSSRVAPQLEAPEGVKKLSQSSATLDEQTGCPNARSQVSNQATKAWVSEAVPPNPPVDLSAPSTSTVHYYRQHHDYDNDDAETSALFAWLSVLLCIPRTGSGRLRSPPGRMDSVDSVDFVTTWQKAQTEAAARPVVPVLKRANEALHTPESPIAAIPSLSSLSSLRGPMIVPLAEARNGRNISFAGGRRVPSSCQLAPSAAPSGDLAPGLGPPGAPDSRTGSRPDSRPTSKRSVRFS